MKRFVIPVLACLAASPAAAQVADVLCDAEDRLERKLTLSYGAELTGRGLRAPDVVLEIWTVPETGKWTLVQSYANGQSCIVAMGEAWEGLTLSGADGASKDL
ncbi:hypothetical protein SAMN05421853_103259 [Roseivivax halotolerans]|uniref:Uncharacterized protein n=1 Tax=Roseivivax halotolerans TaxID=93684 RepID=A0A1I5XAQ0_9RHOB|nr:hypothetical protein [Roseivivax halotolerans]SFQ28926.1 hypothetical protein SAMN05421853_103259 [Roseivivax halotolerans]